MSHQLINFNIPKGLKEALDKITKAKRLSRTAIIIQLLEAYCRTELERMATEPLPHHQTATNRKQEMRLVPLMVIYDRFDGGWLL